MLNKLFFLSVSMNELFNQQLFYNYNLNNVWPLRSGKITASLFHEVILFKVFQYMIYINCYENIPVGNLLVFF